MLQTKITPVIHAKTQINAIVVATASCTTLQMESIATVALIPFVLRSITRYDEEKKDIP